METQSMIPSSYVAIAAFLCFSGKKCADNDGLGSILGLKGGASLSFSKAPIPACRAGDSTWGTGLSPQETAGQPQAHTLGWCCLTSRWHAHDPNAQTHSLSLQSNIPPNYLTLSCQIS